MSKYRKRRFLIFAKDWCVTRAAFIELRRLKKKKLHTALLSNPSNSLVYTIFFFFFSNFLLCRKEEKQRERGAKYLISKVRRVGEENDYIYLLA